MTFGLAAWPAAAAAAAWIIFETTDGGVVIPIRVNGVMSRGILDSGSSHVVVDTALARRAALQPQRRELTVEGWSNSARASPAERVAFTIQGHTATLEALVMSFGATGPPEPVLIGRNFFSGERLEIDFAAGRLRVLPRSGTRVPRGFIRVSRPAGSGPPERGGAVGTIALTVEGREVEARLDLGSGSALHLSRPFVERWRLLEGRPVSAALSGDVGGLRTARLFTCREVGFGGATFRDVPVEVFEASTERAVIGRELIARFRILLDMARENLWVQPAASGLAAPFQKDRAGLAMTRQDGRVTVVFVAPGSPAQAQGWRVGEVVTAIDGVPPYARGRSWRFGPPGEVHRLTTADGAERRLVLADFY